MANNSIEFSNLVQGYWRANTWQFNAQQMNEFIQQHLELGISTCDHAYVYGKPPCEEQFGDALALTPSLREQLEIITKCGIQAPLEPHHAAHYDSQAASIIRSLDTSLSRLKLDYVDVLLIHRPDYLMQADEVAKAFEQLKAAGKVKHFGVSNFNKDQFALLQSRLAEPLVTNQIEINPVNLGVLESGQLEQLQQLNVKPMAWSCLAGGRIFSEDSEQMRRLRSCLTQIQLELDADSIDQVVFAWVMKLPSQPVPVIGSGNIERIKAARAALELTMTQEQWYRIWQASTGYSVP